MRPAQFKSIARGATNRLIRRCLASGIATNPTTALQGIERIVLVRHGESQGNVDERAYVTTADWQVPLTARGRQQGREAGKQVMKLVSPSGAPSRIFFYVSPYLRARQTLREMLREIDQESIVGIREDPRIAEQQFGNFQTHKTIQNNKQQRSEFGRFFFRFPDGGESGFDVYNRVSGFIGTLQRDFSQAWELPESDRIQVNDAASPSFHEGMTVCIVTHGLSLRLFLMRYFQYSVHEFERSYNPANGRCITMKSCKHGGFELSELDRLQMGFPLYRHQERFQLMQDYDLLDKTEW
mmetsp:Transcript_37433/g.89681  ORF Transcript_37433/g.89681 Transcript_37433/m.89681 type:complete len:296 (+) Transcript_37433:228-1115(+)